MKTLRKTAGITACVILMLIALMMSCSKEKENEEAPKVTCGSGSGYPIEFCKQVDVFGSVIGLPGLDAIEVTCLVGPEGATVSNGKNGTYYCSGTYKLASTLFGKISLSWESGTIYIEEPTTDFEIYQGEGSFSVAITKVQGGNGNICLNMWYDYDFIFSTVLIADQCDAIEAPNDLNAVYFPDLSQVKLFWVDNSHNETGFDIYRSVLPTTEYEKIGEVGVDKTTYTDVEYAADQVNYYQIRAKSDVANSITTPSVSVNTSEVAITLTDIDGNTYKAVRIGTQIWMAENLKVTHYRNGDSIPNIKDETAWSSLTTGACCSYNNNNENSITYGKIYNWYAVEDSRNIAPAGWHVPTNSEWTTLANYLGGENKAGGKLKEAGTEHWYSPNIAATNQYGFTAVPGGCRLSIGEFIYIRYSGYWWSAKESATPLVFWWKMNNDGATLDNGGWSDMESGYCIRCVKD